MARSASPVVRIGSLWMKQYEGQLMVDLDPCCYTPIHLIGREKGKKVTGAREKIRVPAGRERCRDACRYLSYRFVGTRAIATRWRGARAAWLSVAYAGLIAKHAPCPNDPGIGIYSGVDTDLVVNT